MSPRLDPKAPDCTHGRVGTAWMPEDDLRRLFGPSHLPPTGDGKVTCTWLIATEAGTVQMGDYWWNRPGEWSLRGTPQAVALAVGWLVETHGIRAELDRPWRRGGE